jgi:uncharacterized delta-60 repeat protein
MTTSFGKQATTVTAGQRKAWLVLATVAAICLCEGSPLFAQLPNGGFATRFTSSGSVDTSFGVDGVNEVFASGGSAAAATIDADNRIIIAGTLDDKFAVTRLGVSGGTDRSFGYGGVATRAFTAKVDARAVAIDPWGRIIVAGTTAGKFALACFTDYGGACSGFGNGSKTTTSFEDTAEATSIAIASDGRIVVGGQVKVLNGWKNEEFALARYTTSGVLDSGFGAGGKVVYDAAPAPSTFTAHNVELIRGLAIDASGRIVAAGAFAAENISTRFAALRFHGHGALDKTFGPNGTGMATAFGGCSGAGCFDEAEGTSLAVQSNGKIVVGGWARLHGSALWDGDVALTRLLSDGSRDVSGFGSDGYVLTDLGGNMAGALSVKIAGSIFVAGFADDTDRAMVARYSLSDGALDTSFDGGVLVGSPCDQAGYAFAIGVQTFPCRGDFCVPIRKPVIVGTCFLYQ